MTRLLLLFIILLTSAYFGLAVIPACNDNAAHSCFDLHREIMNHTAEAPYRYRVLTPALIQVMGAGDNEQFLGSYFIFQTVQFALFFIGLYRWLQQWTDAHGALLGVALTALTFPLMYRFYWYAPYTSFEATLIIWGLLCLQRIPRSSCLPA